MLPGGLPLPRASNPTHHGFIFRAIPLLFSVLLSYLYFSKQLLKNGLGAKLLNPVLFLSSWAFSLHLALQCILDSHRQDVPGLFSHPWG